MPESAPGLDDIRARIDEIDRSMHTLLIERGGLIDELQRAKGLGGPSGTSAMRPAREAQMMRALASRHTGLLPLAVVERIWREIIAGFTQLQAPFRVVLAGPDRTALVETGRYYFGVTTPLMFAGGAGEVLRMIAEDESMAGVIAADADEGAEPWWALLAGDLGNPARVVARLPFFKPHDGGAPARAAHVLSRAPVEPSGADVTLIAFAGTGAEALRVAGTFGAARLAASFERAGGPLHLVEIAGCHGPDAFAGQPALRWLGGFGVADGGKGA